MAKIYEADPVVRQRNLEQEQLLGYWIKKYGISKKTLDTHPCADDLVSLLNIRLYLAENKRFTTLSIDAKIGVMWQSVYNRRQALYPKHYKTLEKIVLDIENRKALQAEKISTARAKIQQARLGNG